MTTILAPDPGAAVDYSGKVALAFQAFHAHPTQANLDALHHAVNEYQIYVTVLDEPFLDEIRALRATEGPSVAGSMFTSKGLRLGTMTLPWAGVGAVALAVFLAMKGRRR